MKEQNRFGYIHRVVGDAVWDHVLPILKLKFAGLDNLESIDELMTQSGTAMFATNHESHLDFLILAKLLQENIAARHSLALLASMKFFDGSMNPLISGMAHYLAGKHDFTLIPTIQQNDDNYAPQEQSEHNAEVLRSLKKLMKDGATIIGLAPEGGRNDNGSVKRALRGSSLLLRFADYFYPVAVNNTHKIIPKTGVPNPFAEARITVGNPIAPSDLISASREHEIKPQDQMMLEILKFLPPEKWGAYSQYLP